MVRLRDAVIAADEQNGDVETALRQLREHIHGHMNTNLATGEGTIKPPLHLKYRYERLVAAEQEKAAANNSKLYTEAQAYCERLFPSGLSGGGRVPCIQEYVLQRGGAATQPTIPAALYQFDFVSPTWSPDLAGLSLVATIVFGVLFVIRWAVERWVENEL